MLEETEELLFQSNLVRRVKNLALGPTTPSNALVPLYEAIYNSIHAVQDRFLQEWVRGGRIGVSIFMDNGAPSVEIRDNGIGLDNDNFTSFRTYDSDHKAKRGGKGVGRLSWLKVFDSAEVTSVFALAGELYVRHFYILLDNLRPIQQHTVKPAPDGQIGTVVKLIRMKPEYARHMPSRTDTILRKIAAHFLPYLVSKAKPSITIETATESYDLGEFLGSQGVELGELDFPVSETEELHLEHNLLRQGVLEGKVSHTLYLAAHDRVVASFDIGLALGLATYIERDGQRYAYAGVVSGSLLDEAVNSERTAFDLDAETIELTKRGALAEIKIILGPQLDRVIDKQTDLLRNVVKKYPRFSYLLSNPRDFVADKIPRNFRTSEQIYQHLALYDFRENRDIERKVEVLSKEKVSDEDPVQSGVQAIVSRLTAQEFSVLADYTVRRKVVLDLLERRLGYRPDGTMKQHAEEALHSFVVPMRVTNSEIHIDKHNLWIIDDKLTYYEHWASDKKLKTLLAESDSGSRPDVLLFGGRTAYHRPGTDQPVVIIEFKKPVRNDYNDDENPFTQIYGYIEELRAGKVLDRSGGLIQEISETTPFFCYIIADLTPNLRKWLRMAQINVPLPGGGGFYGYNDDYKAFIQALSYRYVLKDARMRNEAFFKQLGI
ncbi:MULTISPECIES: ATP-binding protein [unclassified Mesorhizobium]|uniref:ATP-binding protein n=1 Tax=unclassified Mesorhizobium TaxID=325217 RepID=UPI000427BC84|nr:MULTISPECIES: ATP-binding protein [unclassified Mesorhizobium]